MCETSSGDEIPWLQRFVSQLNDVHATGHAVFEKPFEVGPIRGAEIKASSAQEVGCPRAQRERAVAGSFLVRVDPV